MKEIFEIVFRPKEIVNKFQNAYIHWGNAMIVLLLMMAINHLLMSPIGIYILRNSDIIKNISPDQLNAILATQEKIKYVLLFVGLITFIIQLFIMSFLLWSFINYFIQKIQYKKLVSFIIISYSIIVLGELCNSGLNYIFGYQDNTSMLEVYKTGLNVFFNENMIGKIPFTVLYYINPFQIWYSIIIYLGLRVVFDLNKYNAIITTLIFWLIRLLLPVIMIAASTDNSSNLIL
jgi:hypothetical protein